MGLPWRGPTLCLTKLTQARRRRLLFLDDDNDFTLVLIEKKKKRRAEKLQKCRHYQLLGQKR